MDSIESVVVAVRIRPFSEKERIENEAKSAVKLLLSEPQVLIAGGRGFAFDHILNEGAEQHTVYLELIKPRLQHLYNGYNSSIIAYGQTGTGKTYTIGTEPKYCSEESQGGILERVIKDILCTAEQNNASVMISFMEIYNEEAYDLLGQNSKKLVVQGFAVQNLTCLEVTQYEEAKQYLISGASNRHTRSTKMNASSSRSHAIFTVYYCQYRGDSVLQSRINLVDLAGSEGVRNTGNKGDALVEATHINKGLLHVGRVIASLSEKHSEFVSYRSSLLTTVLKDSLSQKSYITMIACISPSNKDIGQTLTTLRFAEQAKKVMTRPKIASFIDEYKKSNPEEFEQMSLIMEQVPSTPSVKLNKGKQKPGLTYLRKPFAPFNMVHSTPSISGGVFRRPNLNVSAESTTASYCNSSSVSSYMDASDLSPVIRKHVEEVRKELMNEISGLVRSELQRTLRIQEDESTKENLSTLQNAYQMSLHQDSSDLSSTVLHNNVRRSVRLAQKNLLHSSSTAHSDKCIMTTAEEVNNTVIPNNIERANIHPLKSFKRVSQTSVRRSARLPANSATSSTPQSDSFKSSANTTDISILTSTSPACLDKDFTTGENAYKFLKRNEETEEVSMLKESIIQPRRSIRIQSLKEKQDTKTKEIAGYTNKSHQISHKKPQASLRAVTQKSHKIAKQNCRCNNFREVIHSLNLSPVSKVKKHILELLNGSLRDIVKLPTIGPKRAFIIYNYRLIRDCNISKIEELKDIPGLPNSFYQQFVQVSILKASCLYLSS